MPRRELEALTRRNAAEILYAIGPEKDAQAPDQDERAGDSCVMDTSSMHVAPQPLSPENRSNLKDGSGAVKQPEAA
jgi:hypothetical protein